MLKAKTSILFLCLLTMCGCFSSAKTEVSKIGIDAHNKPFAMRNGKPIRMNGVFYALPRTMVKAKVPVQREDKFPGKFAEFAPCFLPHKADDAILSRSTAFSIGTPEFTERGVPDLDEVYMIRIKGGYFEDKSLTLGLTEAGVFTNAEASSEDRSVDVALSVLDTALDVGTQVAGLKLANRLARIRMDAITKTSSTPLALNIKGQIPELALTPEQDKCYEKLKTAYLDDKLTKAKYQKEVETTLKGDKSQEDLNRRVEKRVAEEVDSSLPQAQQNRLKERITSEEKDKLRAEIREDIKDRWLGKPKLPPPGDPHILEVTDVAQALNTLKNKIKHLYPEAEESFAQIQAKQDQLDTLIAGSALPNTQSDALKLTIEQIKAEIDTLQARYFLGSTKSDEWTGTFEFDPAKPSAQPGKSTSDHPLFVFSAAGGICELKETQANKVKPNFKVTERCTNEFQNEQVTVSLKVEPAASQLASTIKQAVPDDASDHHERGFYYRVPGVALVQLLVTDANGIATEKARKSDVQIAQYGMTASIPASTGGRTTKYVLNLFESSGAMKNFTLGSNALITKSQIDELNSTVNATLEAKAKRKQAEIDAELDAKDELKRLKREREILEEKNKIEAEKKKLQGTTP